MKKKFFKPIVGEQYIPINIIHRLQLFQTDVPYPKKLKKKKLKFE